jgi:hypothetical protein
MHGQPGSTSVGVRAQAKQLPYGSFDLVHAVTTQHSGQQA